jgi:RNA polymerase sigma-70 factor (ECF subfamily)
MALKIYRTNESELIQACIRHERVAQKRLFDTYSPKMYTLCHRYLKDAKEAEDVLIRSFTRILNRIHQYNGEGSFEGWVRRIVINEALASLRRNRTLYLEVPLEEAEYEIDYGQLQDQLEAEELLNMIGELPAGYRAVFNLYALDGYTHKEIAEQLGISESTSKSQLNRARNYLKKLLEKENLISKKQVNDTTT